MLALSPLLLSLHPPASGHALSRGPQRLACAPCLSAPSATKPSFDQLKARTIECLRREYVSFPSPDPPERTVSVGSAVAKPTT